MTAYSALTFAKLKIGDEFIYLEPGRFHLKPFKKKKQALAMCLQTGCDYAMASTGRVNRTRAAQGMRDGPGGNRTRVQRELV